MPPTTDAPPVNPPASGGAKRILAAVFWSLAGLFVLANAGFAAAFSGRALPGVKANGVDLGGLDRQEARARLAKSLDHFKVHLVVGSSAYDLHPSQLGIDYDLESTLDQAFMVGRGEALPLLGLLEKPSFKTTRLAYQVDQNKFNDWVARIASTNSTVAVDAAVVVKNAQPTVVPDVDGRGVGQDHLARELRHAVADGTADVTIAPEPVKAVIQAPDVAANIESARQIISSHLELHYQDKTFVPSAADISSWLSFKKRDDGRSYDTGIDAVKVRDLYLNKVVGAQVNIPATPRKVTAVNGVVKDNQAGVDGLAVDVDPLSSAIAAQLVASRSVTLDVPTKPVHFTTLYNNTISLDFGKYVEINLTTQHLWAYQDHALAYDSPITSGATGAGLGTVTGLFSVQAKQRNRNLNGYAIGYNYNVYVQYWMPFHADYGMHDASWRSSFGGPDYYYGGSHGCVNMPLETAAWLFGWVDAGTPVWIHS